MIDPATIELWLTDATLLGLAYWLGRVHCAHKLRETYTKNLQAMLDEVRAVRRKVDHLNNLYAVSQMHVEQLKRDREHGH